MTQAKLYRHKYDSFSNKGFPLESSITRSLSRTFAHGDLEEMRERIDTLQEKFTKLVLALNLSDEILCEIFDLEVINESKGKR